MTSASRHDSWWKKLIEREFVRFLLVGASNTAFFYAAYALCLRLIEYRLAYTVAFALSVVFSYWLNAQFVFRVKMSLTGLLRFPFVYLVQYVMGIAMMYVLVDRLNVSANVAPILVVCLTIPITFALSRHLLRGGRSR